MRRIDLLALPLAIFLGFGPAVAETHRTPERVTVIQQQAPSFTGTYVYVAGSSDNIGSAIEKTVKETSFIIRSFARSKLKKTNVPYEQITFARPDQKVSIATNQWGAITLTPNGAPVQWKRPSDGEAYNVSLKATGNKMTQTFASEDGQRVNEFTLSPDGKTLTMHVTVSSPKLPKPLMYNLTYRANG